MIDVRVLAATDVQLLERIAPGLFDKRIRRELATEFLNDPRHHFVAAIDGDVVVGFVSAVHYVHPDKPTELWINEVAVAPSHRGRGLSKAMLREMLALAERLGCTEAWVLTDAANAPAMRAYAAVGGIESAPQIMFTFRLHGGAPQRTEAG
jgi:aminoglycoside 6'-N-acetyltransferase I